MPVFRPSSMRPKAVRRSPQLTFALNAEGRLVYIDEVPKGYACHCRCPHCQGALIARNEGLNSQHHFAHASGQDCKKAQETALHLLTKEIIYKQRTLMLPPFKAVYPGNIQHFEHIEIETRNDAADLQPDLVGITRDKTGRKARLLIEVRVHHAVDERKVDKIRTLNLHCVEVDMRHFLKKTYTREEVEHFICQSKADRKWINNPVLEARQLQYEAQHEAQRREHIDRLAQQEATVTTAHPTCLRLCLTDCEGCLHHSLYEAIHQEIEARTLPQWTRDVLNVRPKDLTKSLVCRTERIGIKLTGYTQLLHTTGTLGGLTPEDEKVYDFFEHTVPRLARQHLRHCTKALAILPYEPSVQGTRVLCKDFKTN